MSEPEKLKFKRPSQYKTPDELRTVLQQYAEQFGLCAGCDDTILTKDTDSPIAEPFNLDGFQVWNRGLVQPLEKWGSPDFAHFGPGQLDIRHFVHAGLSGCGVFWGPATGLRDEWCANPAQLRLRDDTKSHLEFLFKLEKDTFLHRFGEEAANQHFRVFQATHSGRWCSPHEHTQFVPLIFHEHPVLDKRQRAEGFEPTMLTDTQLSELPGIYGDAAEFVDGIGVEGFDVKMCHGYGLHTQLSAKTRSGEYGGSLENRMKIPLGIVREVKSRAPRLRVVVRLSAYDLPPQDPDVGDYDYANYHFGVSAENPEQWDLGEVIEVCKQLREAGVSMINISAACPYYSALWERPSMFNIKGAPPLSRDPLIEAVRLIGVVQLLKAAVPGMAFCASGTSYLQEWQFHVAQWFLRKDFTDFWGCGRLFFSDPAIIARVVHDGGEITRKRLCRTYLDCIRSPRGLGDPDRREAACFPLDPWFEKDDHTQALTEKRKADNP